MSLARVFIHGLESSSRGTKGVFLRERYPGMIIPDFHGPLQERMHKLSGLLSDHPSLIMVGSSFGGLMAAIYALETPNRVKKLILLAPALTFPDFEPYSHHRIEIPVTVYHGKKDDVVPAASTYEVARKIFGNLAFNAVDDDHMLSKTFKGIDWDNLLETKPAPGRASENPLKKRAPAYYL
jgi:pimeloyl-ACP methyl ester carboxylesterase